MIGRILYAIVGRAPWPAFFAGIVAHCLLLSALPLRAQPGFRVIDSIEVTVANADSVFVGRIVSIQPTARKDAGRVSVAVSVEETLKGGRGEKWSVDLALPESVVAGWLTHASRLLVAVDIAAPSATAIDLSSDILCVYTEDFVCLRSAASVIQAAKDVVRRTPAGVKRINAVALMFPPGTLNGGSGYDYATTRLHVPVDERLEKRAHAILRGDIRIDRADAVGALKYFKSDENIRLMKSLLNDPATGINRSAEDNMGVEVRIYYIRESAYGALKAWGIDVPEPVLREETVHLDRVTTVSLWNKPGTVTDAPLRELARFPNLIHLDLLNDRLADSAWEAIGTLKTLRRLGLAGTNVTDAALANLAGLPHLEELDLRSTRITSGGLAALGGFTTLKKLQVVRTRANAAAIAALQQRRPDLVIEIK